MAARTNLAKVISDPNAGKHYLFKDGQFVNEWAGKTVSDVKIYKNGVTGAYTATIQNNSIAIPSVERSNTYEEMSVEFPAIPAATMAAKDHVLIHFTDKNFVDCGEYSCVCAGHTDLSSLNGFSFGRGGTDVFLGSSGYMGYIGAKAIGTHYTYICAKETYSDDVSGKHFVAISTEESSETDPHILFLADMCGNAENAPAFAISEIYLENID